MTKLPCDHYYKGQKYTKGTVLKDCPLAVQKAVIDLNEKEEEVPKKASPKKKESKNNG